MLAWIKKRPIKNFTLTSIANVNVKVNPNWDIRHNKMGYD